VLINILYDSGQEQLANVCEYSLHHQSPTIVIRRINRSQINTILNDQDNQWFLCCSAKVLFLNSPLLLFEYAHPHKSVCRIYKHPVADSPITLWNGTHATRLTLREASDKQTDWTNKTGEIPREWACYSQHASPKAIIFKEIMDPGYTVIWNDYEEETIHTRNKRD